MDLNTFSAWLSATAPSQAIQTTSWAIPAIQTIHILALALVAAAALLLALRVAGRGLVAETLPQLAGRFVPLIWMLLLVLLLSGSLLILAEPGRTITNPVFYAKMIMLALVIAATLWLSAAARRTAGRPSALMVAVAVLSLLLWTGIIFAGRLIAYYESY